MIEHCSGLDIRDPAWAIKIALVLTLIALASACSRDPSPERLDELVQAYYENGQLHGGILVAEGNTVTYANAFGQADFDLGLANTVETRFPIFSITKPFTAVLVLQLVEKGELQLDGTLSEYLPGFESEASEKIQIHHLLSHTSGLPDYFLTLPGFLECQDVDLSLNAVMEAVGAMPLEFEPGEAFAYSNTGYVLLARIVEGVAGKDFSEVLEERIFDPVGMTATQWQPTQTGPGIARLYLSDGETEAPDQPYFIGDGGIVSTLEDMHRFALAIGSPTLLSAENWALALQPHANPEAAHRPHPAHENPFGYGFSLAELPYADGASATAAVHGGADCGGSAWFQRFIEHDRVVIFWNNLGGIPPFLPGLDEKLASE